MNIDVVIHQDDYFTALLDDFKQLRRMDLPNDEVGRHLTTYRATDEPTELPDKDIVPDETPPLEDEPVKTDQVPDD